MSNWAYNYVVLDPDDRLVGFGPTALDAADTAVEAHGVGLRRVLPCEDDVYRYVCAHGYTDGDPELTVERGVVRFDCICYLCGRGGGHYYHEGVGVLCEPCSRAQGE